MGSSISEEVVVVSSIERWMMYGDGKRLCEHGRLFRGELDWVLMALMEYHVEGTATKVHQIPLKFVHLAKACMQIQVEKKQLE
ncbi:hypothetical protein MTR_1g070305 [Medicago truncatula]|uniref:Uncharacterized protein n=1 Tax=Medicago truncatula TaxID=3880 RepID=A0A072VMC7_MEDTR|nr:hypothetical protein MTR_1g070305 [Medicago truncatula]